MIISADACDTVAEIIQSPEDFWDHRHATIYQAMLATHEAGKPVDTTTLVEKLRDMGALDQVGGVPYIIQLVEVVPGPSGIKHYAESVRERALRRKAIELCEDTLKIAYGGGMETSALIDSTANSLYELKPATDKADGHLARFLEEAVEDEHPGIPTGLAALDGIIHGLEPGTFNIVGARPSMGKTALGVCMAMNMAESGAKVGFFSAEMRGKRIARRVACAELRMDTETFKQKRESLEVRNCIDRMRDWPLWLDETGGAHIDRVCARIRKWKREHDVDVVFVDYLQLLSHDRDGEYDGVTEMSRKLKAVAGETGVVLMALSQLNRANTTRTDKRPTMADLRSSGAVEQDADVIMLIHRQNYYDNPIEQGAARDDEAEIIIAKNRDGATGTAHVGWIGRCGVFSSGALKSPAFAGSVDL